MTDWKTVDAGLLESFVVDVLMALDVPRADAKITADVLLKADRRGISSHGVARLRRYVNGLRNGLMNPHGKIDVVHETDTTLTVDGGAALGQAVSYNVMRMVLDKAEKSNIAFASVRNSNHYGIAGYYSMMALDRDMIGISMTNSAPLVVPTFGKNAFLGTNPISIAVPTGRKMPVVLDMATSTVPRGKLEVYNRRGMNIPPNWATDASGEPTTDPGLVLDNILHRKGGGLLPLGGAEEESGGHKGYGLSFMVDIFTSILSGGGTFGPHVYENPNQPPGVCHFFGAINIDAFVDRKIFKSLMDQYIDELKNAEKRDGQDIIYIHGEKEFEKAKAQEREIELYHKVVEDLRDIGRELGLDCPF